MYRNLKLYLFLFFGRVSYAVLLFLLFTSTVQSIVIMPIFSLIFKRLKYDYIAHYLSMTFIYLVAPYWTHKTQIVGLCTDQNPTGKEYTHQLKDIFPGRSETGHKYIVGINNSFITSPVS